MAAGEIQLLEAGGDVRQAREDVRYNDIDSMFVERCAPAKNAWEPALVLVLRSGDRIAIGSLEGLDALYQLTELVAHVREQVAA